MKYKNVVFVASDQIKNLGNFRNYLIENTSTLFTYHFFQGYTNERSYLEKFVNGKKIFRKDFPLYGVNNNFLRLFIYYAYFIYVLLRYADDAFVIVEKPFFLIFNSVISITKNLKFVYWIGDYYPENSGFMFFYNKLANYYNERLDYVMYESPPIKHAYLSKLSKSIEHYKLRSLVTLGMENKYNNHKANVKMTKIGFIGVIRFQQGLDLIFEYLKTESNVHLDVVGAGYKLEYYKKLAKKMKIANKVKFYGYVEDPRKIIQNWDIGIALYVNSSDNVSKYCEPTKIKDYLEYGIPVITTNTTYFHKELKKSGAGEVINETKESLGGAIDKIKSNYSKYLASVEKLVEKYEYQKWYDTRFKFLET